MATDRSFEVTLADALHRHLDAVDGPHPRWHDSPAGRSVAEGSRVVAAARSRRRWTVLLAAAALVVALVAATLVATGGLESRVLPMPSPSAVPAVVAPTSTPTRVEPTTAPPTIAPTASPCVTEWHADGTADPRGLVDGIRVTEFDGYDGHLTIGFGHALDTVQRIAIEPVVPPFTDEGGKLVKVAGLSFYQLTIEGLTRATANVPDDLVAAEPVGPFGPTVASPIAEARRIRTPREVLPKNGPGKNSTEVWIVGMDRPSCLDVRTLGDPGFGEPGPNAVRIGFLPEAAVLPDDPASASPAAAAGECLESWDRAGDGGSRPADLLDLHFDLDSLSLRFAGDRIPAVSLATTAPPFTDTDGRRVAVDGNAFLRLTVHDLGADDAPPAQGRGARGGDGFTITPFTQIRKIDGKGATHVWIIGLSWPVCFHPGGGAPGPGAVSVGFGFTRP